MRIHLKIWELDKNEEMRRGQQTVRSDIGARIFDSRARWWSRFQYRAGLICRKGSDATSKSSLWFQSFWCEKVCCSNFWNHQYLPLILIIWSASSCSPVITGANMCTSYICSSVCVTKFMWRTKLHIFVDKLYLLVGNLPCCEKIIYKVYGSNSGLNCSDTQPDHLAGPNLSSCAPSTIAAPCTVRLKSALVKLAVETHMRSIIASVERFSEYLNLHNCTSSSHQRDELCSWHGSARKWKVWI